MKEYETINESIERVDDAADEAVKSIDWLDTAIKAVKAEPELPDRMPDVMWDAIRNDRDVATEAMRIIVQQTKAGIIDRLISNA